MARAFKTAVSIKNVGQWDTEYYINHCNDDVSKYGTKSSYFMSDSELNRIDNFCFKTITGCYFPNCSYINGKLGDGNVAYRTIKTAILPKCKYIGGGVFANQPLWYISAPDCEYVGDYAFYSDSALAFASFSKCSYVGYAAYSSCTAISYASFPSCNYIGDYAFFNCSILTSVYFPKCEYIGSHAFYSTPFINAQIATSPYYYAEYYASQTSRKFLLAFTSDATPSTLFNGTDYYGLVYGNPHYFGTKVFDVSLSKCNYVGDYYFSNCLISSMSLPVCKSIFSSAFANASLGYAYLPQCERIYADAFSSASIGEIILTNCKYIDDYAFESANFSYMPVISNVISVGSKAFCSCKFVSYISSFFNMPKCEYISNYAFWNMAVPKSAYLSLPKVKSIGTYGLLTSTTISQSELYLPECEYLADYALKVGSLISINLPKCKYIGTNNFTYLYSSYNTSIYLGACETLNSAFYKCSSITFTIATSKVCFISNSSISYLVKSLYVPSSLVTSYKNNVYWSVISSKIFAMS